MVNDSLFSQQHDTHLNGIAQQPLLQTDQPIAVINISFPTLNDSAGIKSLFGNSKKGDSMVDKPLLSLLSPMNVEEQLNGNIQKSIETNALKASINNTVPHDQRLLSDDKDKTITVESPQSLEQNTINSPPVMTTTSTFSQQLRNQQEQQPLQPLATPPLSTSRNQQPTSATNLTANFHNKTNIFPSEESMYPIPSAEKTTTTTISVSNDQKTGKPNVELSSSDHQPKINTAGIIECYNASDGTVKCRNKLARLHPHVSTSKFSGNIGIREKGKNGTKVIGGETNNKMNETLNFKSGNSRYDYQNLTSFRNCTGCLKNKKLIKHNTTKPIQLNQNKTQTLQTNNTNSNKTRNNQKQIDDGLSDISKLRNRLRNSKNRTNFFVQNISRPATNHSLVSTKVKPINVTRNNNKTSSRDAIEGSENVQRKCEEVEMKRSGIGNDLVKSGVILSCVTKRRLVATKHTKTKKNGKVVGDSEKPSNNTERAQHNEENAKSNEERKHQSDGNNESNMKQSLSNEKVLHDILNGVHDKPAKDITPEENRNIENKTITLDPSILRGHGVHEGRVPDAEHQDEDVGIMGVDDRPAIETNSTIDDVRNTTKYHEEVNQKKPEKTDTPVDNTNETIKDDVNDHEIKAKEKPKMNENKDKKLYNKPIGKHPLNNNNTISEYHNVTDTHKTLNKTNPKANEVGSALLKNNTSFIETHNRNETVDDSRSENAEENKTPTKRILAFGDSLTKGLYSKNRYNPYSRHLLELLKKGDSNKRKYEIFEEGVNGECACNAMAKRLPEELQFRKDIDLVIIIAGTNDLLKNDCLNKCDLFEAIKRLHEIAHRKKVASVLTTILESTFTPAKMSTKDYKTVLSDVNQQIRGYGQQQEVKSKKLKLCDIADELPRKSPLSLDRIHPTREGYDQLAEIIYSCVKDFKF